MNSKCEETPYLLQQRERFVPRGLLTAHPLVIERAQGSELWDVDGKRYLDFVGGIGVMNIGLFKLVPHVETMTQAVIYVGAGPLAILCAMEVHAWLRKRKAA